MQIVLKKDKLYQIVFISPKFTHQSMTINALYFGSLGESIALGLGAQSLITLDVIELEHSDIDAQNLLIIEWPSNEVLTDFQHNIDWLRILPERDNKLKGVHTASFRVREDTQIDLEPEGVYELAGFWTNRHNAQLMTQYFEKMASVVKKAQPQPLAQMDVVRTDAPYDLKPHKLNFLHWRGGYQSRSQMFKSKEFKQNGYLRALALDRLLTLMVKPQQ